MASLGRSLAALLVCLSLVASAACSSAGAPGGGPDAGELPSADAAPGVSPEDGGGAPGPDSDADAGADGAPGGPDDLLGTRSGPCGTLKALLAGTAPALEKNWLAFTMGESYGRAALSAGGQRIYDEPNAGGSSKESEVMSFEVLRHCEAATLVKTETEIQYQPPGPPGTNAITDILVEIDGKKIGVSVTRAYKPPSIPLTDADVKALLEKKLDDVLESSARVLPGDKWVKQILHVFAVDADAEAAVARVWPTIDAGLRADTIVLVTRTSGGGFVYCDPDPPLGSECQ